jgi:hypothetical protein
METGKRMLTDDERLAFCIERLIRIMYKGHKPCPVTNGFLFSRKRAQALAVQQ